MLLSVIKFFQSKKKYFAPFQNKKVVVLLLIVIFSDILVGILFAKNQQAALLAFFRLCEWIFVAYKIASFPWTKKSIQIFSIALALQMVLVSSIATLQFLTQHSLGGIFYFMGERTFSLQTPGIADATLGGQLFLRPYATFPHPNVLAGYLIVVMSIGVYLMTQLFSIKKKWRQSNLFFLLLGATLFGTVTLFLTLTRVAIVLWFLLLLIFFLSLFIKRITKTIVLITLAMTGLASVIFFPLLRHRFFDSGAYVESFSIRNDLINAALRMIRNNPFFGVGGYNFLPNLPPYLAHISFSLLQPVHNIFLLITSEYGLLGLSISAYLLVRLFNKLRHSTFSLQKKTFLYVLFSLPLVLGLSDHYLLTLEQGQFLFALCIGLLLSSFVKVKI